MIRRRPPAMSIVLVEHQDGTVERHRVAAADVARWARRHGVEVYSNAPGGHTEVPPAVDHGAAVAAGPAAAPSYPVDPSASAGKVIVDDGVGSAATIAPET